MEKKTLNEQDIIALEQRYNLLMDQYVQLANTLQSLQVKKDEYENSKQILDYLKQNKELKIRIAEGIFLDVEKAKQDLFVEISNKIYNYKNIEESKQIINQRIKKIETQIHEITHQIEAIKQEANQLADLLNAINQAYINQNKSVQENNKK